MKGWFCIDGKLVTGWALDPDKLSQKLEIAILVGSRKIGEARADRFRPDIQKQYGGDGSYGFAFYLAGSEKDRAEVRCVDSISGTALSSKDSVVTDPKRGRTPLVIDEFSLSQKLELIGHSNSYPGSKNLDSELWSDEGRISEQVSIEDAVAFILRLDPDVAINTLDNVGNCRVLSSFDDLRACTAGAGPCVQSKPVIILSRDVQTRRDHLVAAVASHWQYGGKYVLSRVKCSYLSKTGKLQVEPVLKLEMHRIALLPCILTMPVREALLAHSQLLLFVPSDEFTVCIPQMSLSREEIRRLEHVYRPEFQTPVQFERLAKMGALNHSVLRRLPVRMHWPLTHLITSRLADYRQLNLDLESRNFSKSTIEATISLIKRLEDDLLYLREKLNEFLVSLSRRTDILLQLEVRTIESYIALSRQCSRAGEIANNLSLTADSLCRIDHELIAPLFEFLASNLSPEELNAAYCFAAAHLDDEPERCVRLAQSMRKFGHETSLGLLLVNLYKTKPSWLQKPKVLRSFQPLLSLPILHALASQVGEETVSSMRALINITERFRDAVRAGDRLLARQILRNEEELAKVDFLPWMNSLRSLSYELREMALPVADLKMPGIHNLSWQRLAAIRFFDREVIEAMRASGALNTRDDLNAAALSVAGDNTMLNKIILEKFASARLVPMEVEGETASEVFINAATSTRNFEKIHGPLISVIMSAYNPDLELMKIALDSIRDQTWRNIEVIIVDDASDGPAETAVRKLAATYNNVELIRVAVNSGPYIGRNLAIQRARGDFIAIQDADDWSHPQRFAAQINLLLNTPEARAVTTGHIRINRAGDVALESHFRVFGNGPMTSVFRAEVFQQIGSFAAIRSRGDLEMRGRVAAYYGYQANAALPLPMALCYADSRTLSHSMKTQKDDHIKLFHNNVFHIPDMTSLFRDGLPLTTAHQTPVPIMLRPPHEKLL